MLITILISVILGIIVPTFLPLISNVELDIGDQIIIGLLTGTLPLLVEIGNDLNSMQKLQSVEKKRIIQQNKFDDILIDISKRYEAILLRNGSAVFADYFTNRMREIDSLITDASEKKKFSGMVQHVVADDYIVGCFGSSNKVWRMTWFLDSSDRPSVEETWDSYFKRALRLLSNRTIATILILFLAETTDIYDEICRNPNCGFRTYIDSYKGSKRLEFRCLPKTIFEQNYRNAIRNPPPLSEIGMYGDNLLFIYNPENENVGEYNQNPDDIKEFDILYDNMWKQGYSI